MTGGSPTMSASHSLSATRLNPRTVRMVDERVRTNRWILFSRYPSSEALPRIITSSLDQMWYIESSLKVTHSTGSILASGIRLAICLILRSPAINRAPKKLEQCHRDKQGYRRHQDPDRELVVQRALSEPKPEQRPGDQDRPSAKRASFVSNQFQHGPHHPAGVCAGLALESSFNRKSLFICAARV